MKLDMSCGFDMRKCLNGLVGAVVLFACITSFAAPDARVQQVTASNSAPVSAVNDPRLSVLDPVFYLSKYPDLKQAFGNNVAAAQKHWLENGIREGRDSSPNFSIGAYLSRYPDLQKLYGNDYAGALNHWLQFGYREKRDPQPAGTFLADPRAASLDPIFYANKYPELRQAYGYNVPQLVWHWLQYGIKEGRQPNAQAQPAPVPQAPGSYTRGVGYSLLDQEKCVKENPQGCEREGLVFYPKCSAEYRGAGPVCWKK